MLTLCRAKARRTRRRAAAVSSLLRLLVRVSVGSRGVSMGGFTVFVSRGGMLLGVFMLTDIVKMGRLKVMMRSGLMVSGRLEVMLARRMLC